MNPLDATTPEALFGDAIGDPRALKRAYAALVRAHPPEKDAATFAHIRRMYEIARSGAGGAGGAGSAARPADPGASPGASGSDASAPSADGAPSDADADVDAADVDTILAALVPEAWPATLDALERRVRQGDMQAIAAGYGLLVAVDPERAFPWLTGLADLPGAAQPIAHAIAATFAVMEERSRDPSLDALLDALPAPLGRQLRALRLQALAPFHPARAASMWERERAAVSPDPSLVRDLLLQAFGTIRWHLDAAALHGALALADDARLELSDGDVQLIRAGAHAALAALSYDGPHAVAVRRALAAGHRAPPSRAAAALADLVSEIPDPQAFLARLERDAPGLVGALVEMVDRVSSYDTALLGWAITGAPIPPGDREDRWLDAIDAEVEASIAEERAAFPQVGDGRGPGVEELRRAIHGSWWDRVERVLISVGVVSFVPAIVAIGMGQFVPGVRFAIAGFAMLAIAFIGHAVTRQLQGASSSSSANPNPDEAWARVVLRAVRRVATLGYWPHEVAAALHLRRSRESWAPLAAHLGEPAFTLGAITEAHVRRVVAAEMVASHEAERDAAEQASEDPS